MLELIKEFAGWVGWFPITIGSFIVILVGKYFYDREISFKDQQISKLKDDSEQYKVDVLIKNLFRKIEGYEKILKELDDEKETELRKQNVIEQEKENILKQLETARSEIIKLKGDLDTLIPNKMNINNDVDKSLVEVLSRHYSETFELLKSVVARRDRLFLYILLIIFILLLYMSSPSVMSDWVNSFFSSQLGGDKNTNMTPLIDVSIIGVVLMLGLLSISHTYFQTVLHVERQYDYVYQLEGQLSRYFNEKAFTREGKHYRSYKRRFASWTKFIFWYLFPILYLIFIIVWLLFLFTTSYTLVGYKIIDLSITVSILISLWFYLLAITKRR